MNTNWIDLPVYIQTLAKIRNEQFPGELEVIDWDKVESGIYSLYNENYDRIVLTVDNMLIWEKTPEGDNIGNSMWMKVYEGKDIHEINEKCRKILEDMGDQHPIYLLNN